MTKHPAQPKAVLGTGAKGDLNHPELGEAQLAAKAKPAEEAKPAEAVRGDDE